MSSSSNKNGVIYRLPESDSEEEYDGFYFGDSIKTQIKIVTPQKDYQQELYNAVIEGNLSTVKQKIKAEHFNVNAPIKGGFTLLLHACKEGHLDVVEYLVNNEKANVNKQVDSITPLMNVCDSNCRNSNVIEKMAELLIKNGCCINASDKFGTTPFMLACKNGYTNVVRLMLDDVFFDAIDNQGCTPIFHAIENNRADIVKILIDAKVDYNKPNCKGYTPKQVAQFHGFYDLLELFPKEKEAYLVPSNFLAYNTLRDYIPRIFLKPDCPEYFQEINKILISLNMQEFLEYFARERITLSQFLCMTDEKLKQVGIKLPLYRMKIIKGLLDFHLHHWTLKSIARVSPNSQENFYEVLMITANHLQHLIVINSSIKYVKYHLENKLLGPVDADSISNFRKTLQQYKHNIREVQNTTKYLASFSPPKNPFHIDYNEFLAERNKRIKFKFYFKLTIVAGLSMFLCQRLKHFL